MSRGIRAEYEEVSTYPFVQVPATVLTAFRGIIHALVCLEVPVKVARLFLLSFFIRRKATSASSASIGLFFVQARNEV